MKWTREKPTVPGVYWQYFDGAENAYIVKIDDWDGELVVLVPGSEEDENLKDMLDYLWFGPLDAPKFESEDMIGSKSLRSARSCPPLVGRFRPARLCGAAMKSQYDEASWYNFRTGQYDEIEGTPQDFHDYIPQNQAAQGLFDAYIGLGNTPISACIKVLSACVGEKVNDETR